MAPGELVEELRDLVCASFDLDQLRALVRTKLEFALEDYVAVDGSNKRTVAFDLIVFCDKRGELSKFVRAVAEVRGNKPEVVAFCQRHARFLDAADDVAAAESARQGLDVLVSQQAEPAVVDALRSIQAETRATHDGIHRLETYKLLHERFHTLDFQILRVLEKAARGFSQDPTNDDGLFELNAVTEDLAGEVLRARGLTETLPNEDQQVLLGWIQKLELASQLLKSVVTARRGDAERPVRSLVRPTLGQVPPIVHARLSDETRRLPLRRLIETVSSLADSKEANGASRLLREGLDGLRRLETRLRDLVTEHSYWQKIDIDVRLIDDCMSARSTNPADWLEELGILLPGVAKNLEELCALRPGVAWAIELSSLIHEISQKLAPDGQLQLRILVDRFLRRARGHFFDVDDELRKFCGQLSSVNGKLEQLAAIGGG